MRVADFGLALPAGGDGEPQPEPEPSQSGRSVVRVTAAGSLVGTPAYMAPEQFLRQAADARTDQFAFCAAMFEGLYGYRPFAGETVAEISRNVLLGDMLAPPTRTSVPQWVADILRRGLASEPERRFATMDALLAELSRERSHGRRGAAWAAVVALTLAAVVALSWQVGATCQGAAERLAGVWDPARRDAIARRFLDTGLDYARDTWTRVGAELDEYAGAWIDMHTSACQAHQRGEQSSLALDLRMHCLDRRRTELAALTQIFAEADRGTVTNAVQAVRELSPLAACADTAALLDEQRRLGSPGDPATEARVALLRGKLTRVEALINAGQSVRAAEASAGLPDQARAIGYLPLLAEVLFFRARALQESGAMGEAAATLRRAHLAALRANHEEFEARALVADVFVQSLGLRDFAAAERAHEAADALISRIAPDGELAAELLLNLAAARYSAGRLSEAEALDRAALALLRRIRPDHHQIGAALANLGVDLSEMERFTEAEQVLREALARMQASFGRRHPWAAFPRANLAQNLFDTGALAEARALLDESFPILVEGNGRERPDFAELFAIYGLLHLDDNPQLALADLQHARDLGERAGLPRVRSLTRFALAQGLWDHVPWERARALALARQAAEDAAAAGSAVRRAKIVAWLEEHAPEDIHRATALPPEP